MEFNLRPLRSEDYKDIARHANNKKIADNLTDSFPYPYTENDAKEFLKISINNPEHKAITVNDGLVGIISINRHKAEQKHIAGLGYWLSEEYWGKGIMSKAVKQYVSSYLEENPDILRLEAKVYKHNPVSGKVLEKNGFELEGLRKKGTYTRGRYLDEYVYALIR